MRWERQEGKEMVQDRLGERAVCDSAVCVCKFVYVKVLCVKQLYVTKLCVKDCVWKRCMWQSCVWKSCVWQSCVEELCVCVPPEPVQCHNCHAKWRSIVAKCHACHAKWRSMSPSATPATQTAATTTATNGAQARHQSQSSAISATHSAHQKTRLDITTETPAHANAIVFCTMLAHSRPHPSHFCVCTCRLQIRSTLLKWLCITFPPWMAMKWGIPYFERVGPLGQDTPRIPVSTRYKMPDLRYPAKMTDALLVNTRKRQCHA